MTFRKKLKDARGERGWSQGRLAEMVAEKIGAKWSYDSGKVFIARIENEGVTKRTRILVAACELLGIPVPTDQELAKNVKISLPHLIDVCGDVNFKPLLVKLCEIKEKVSVVDIFSLVTFAEKACLEMKSAPEHIQAVVLEKLESEMRDE